MKKMATIEYSIFLGLLNLPPKDIAELINIVGAVYNCDNRGVDDKILMSMLLINNGMKLFESIGGFSHIFNFHPKFQKPMNYQTGDKHYLGENLEF